MFSTARVQGYRHRLDRVNVSREDAKVNGRHKCAHLLLSVFVAFTFTLAYSPLVAQPVSFTAGPGGELVEPSIPKVMDQATGRTRMFTNLTAIVRKGAPGVYTGAIHRTTGPAFSAMPWNQNTVTETTVGDLTITFVNGNHASFHYALMLGAVAIDQTKSIERFVFQAPGTACQ
jgi:hypothetical protein